MNKNHENQDGYGGLTGHSSITTALTRGPCFCLFFFFPFPFATATKMPPYVEWVQVSSTAPLQRCATWDASFLVTFRSRKRRTARLVS